MTRDLRQLFVETATADWPALPVTGFAIDSREVEPGYAFVALNGSRQHGMAYAEQAIARGAAVILAEPPIPTHSEQRVPVLSIERAQLGSALARFYDNRAGAPVLIGVTGTNGKTSTVQLLAGALTRLGQCAGTIGTLGAGLFGELNAGERTTPDVVASHRLVAGLRAQGATHLAMEVSSHALDQQRVAGLGFQYAAFSNLTRDHLDYHGDMASYGAAKAKLFTWPTLSAAVINIDDPFGRELCAQSSVARILTVSSRDQTADLCAEQIEVDASGLRFLIRHGSHRVAVRTRLLGRFNVDNLLLVAGLLIAMAVPLDRIAATFAELEPVSGRMNRVEVRSAQALVVVDYAHTPDGLDKALTTLREHCRGRLIVVFGCGGDRDPGKRADMGAIAARLADRLIVTDDNPRSEDGDAIVAMILAGASGARDLAVERDRRQAIRRAIAEARVGDVVLIAGKGHEPYQEIGGRQLPFDDREEAALALKEAA